MLYTIDAKNKILGRLAQEVAILLRGKNKPEFVPYKDCGDQVNIINTDKIRVTGNKAKQKMYRSHSGYPGSLRERTFEEVMAQDSREVVRKAIYGMLPKNKLRDKIIKKLKLFKEDKVI